MNYLTPPSRLHFSMWSTIHRLPKQYVAWWQHMELRRALTEAYTHVPLYRELLLEKNITPQDIKSLNDVPCLPITSKQLFRANAPEKTLRDDYVEGKDYIWNQTSGSSGTPFVFAMSSFYMHYSDVSYLRYAEFNKYRSLVWEGIPLSSIVKDMKVAELGVCSPRPNMRFFTLEELAQDPERVLFELQKFQPDILEGFPAIVLDVARTYAKRKNKLHFDITIPKIFTRGEHVSLSQRDFLRTQFGAEVYNRYSLSELGVVGVECKAHDGFHILEESCYVEVVDDEGKQVPPGTEGRVLVSFFYNDVMPFLRYDTEDYGMYMPGTCACGIRSPRLQIRGRSGSSTEVLGREIGTAYFELLVGHYSTYILEFQVARTEKDTFEIRIVPTSAFNAQVAERIGKECLDSIGVVPKIVLYKKIQRLKNGKIKVFVDES